MEFYVLEKKLNVLEKSWNFAGLQVYEPCQEIIRCLAVMSEDIVSVKGLSGVCQTCGMQITEADF